MLLPTGRAPLDNVLEVLAMSGILTPSEAFSGFSNSGLLTVAAMFVLAGGIRASGGVDLVVNQLLRTPKSERRAIGRLMAPVMLASAFINNTPVVSQPNALAAGQTVSRDKADITITQQAGSLIQMPAGTQLVDVVKALNSLGATPQDLLAILQAIKAAGALNAELEVI